MFWGDYTPAPGALMPWPLQPAVCGEPDMLLCLAGGMKSSQAQRHWQWGASWSEQEGPGDILRALPMSATDSLAVSCLKCLK